MIVQPVVEPMDRFTALIITQNPDDGKLGRPDLADTELLPGHLLHTDT